MDNIIDIASKIITPNFILFVVLGITANLFVARFKKSNSKKDMYASPIFVILRIAADFFNIFVLSLLIIVIILILFVTYESF